MKRFIILVVGLMVVFNVYSQTGVFREVTGDVEVRRPGETAFTAVSAGSVITQDTIISTGFRSSAVVAIGSTVITVRPLTRLSLAEISSAAGEENLNVNLQAGRVRVDVSPPAGTRANTTLRGPTATASVRGTSFEMDIMRLTVDSGTVVFRGSNGLAFPVSSGDSSFVTASGGVVDPVQVAVSNLQPPAPGGDLPSAGSTTEVFAPSTGSFDLTVTWPSN